MWSEFINLSAFILSRYFDSNRQEKQRENKNKNIQLYVLQI